MKLCVNGFFNSRTLLVLLVCVEPLPVDSEERAGVHQVVEDDEKAADAQLAPANDYGGLAKTVDSHCDELGCALNWADEK